ncbi:MAG: alpha/beta hydrolase [Bacteroidota bacterium]
MAVFLFLNVIQGQNQLRDTIIHVEGQPLHFRILIGEGNPILFESGNGDDGSVWDPILDSIYQQTKATLITYDRVGLGKSDLTADSISFQAEVRYLEQALSALGIDDDLLLVAHSFGGFYSSLFAYNNRSRVKGAVFIDIATPCFMAKEWSEDYISGISEMDWKMIKEHRTGLYYTLQNLPAITDYMASRFLRSEVPLTLIAAENLPNENTLRTEVERVNYVKCLHDYGHLPNHKYILAQGADHHVWRKRPDLVVEEITRLYQEVTNKKE